MHDPNSQYVPLVDVYRGRLIESVHYGVLVVAGTDGRIVASLGSPDLVTYPRSSLKPFQALELVVSGAAEAFGLEPRHLALACASHRAEPFQMALVRDWLERLQLTSKDLACGVAWPKDLAARDRMIAVGEPASAMCHNCSGKHAGMLSVCRHQNSLANGYHLPGHPLQQSIVERTGRLIGRRIEASELATDGCNLPAIPLSMREMASATARFAARVGSNSSESAAMERLLDGMGRHPDHVSGRGQPTQMICDATNGRILVKPGAEGFLSAWLRDDGIGIAIKIADGAERASFAVLVETLARLRLISSSETDALEALRHSNIVDPSGNSVASIRCRSATFQTLV